MSADKFSNPVVRWIDHRLPVFSMLDHTAHEYPTPKNLNYMWNFGSLAGLSLVIMIVTGIVLAMSYTAHVDYAFGSVERIMRDVRHGWLIRYIHMNTASFFFGCGLSSHFPEAFITALTRRRVNCCGSLVW